MFSPQGHPPVITRNDRRSRAGACSFASGLRTLDGLAAGDMLLCPLWGSGLLTWAIERKCLNSLGIVGIESLTWQKIRANLGMASKSRSRLIHVPTEKITGRATIQNAIFETCSTGLFASLWHDPFLVNCQWVKNKAPD